MSDAKPMTWQRREAAYRFQAPAGKLTVRQWRTLSRRARLEELREGGQLKHGASGARTRKPIRRRLQPAPGI